MNNQQQPFQNEQQSNQIPAQQNHGGHALLDADEAIGVIMSGIEQYNIFGEHIQDQELSAINERQKSFLSQVYNTFIETMKTGQDPTTPTHTYMMDMPTNVTYGLQQSAPKSPLQSSTELNDECISTYMMNALKAMASNFTLAALEATNPVLRRVIADSIPNIIEMGYELFLYQNKNQYYQVPQLNAQDMSIIQNGYAPIQGIQGTH
ncbi:MAG TPA: spore coat protein [Bacillota bacterium]|nr:spore coat protein [Bacillota bacterium]